MLKCFDFLVKSAFFAKKIAFFAIFESPRKAKSSDIKKMDLKIFPKYPKEHVYQFLGQLDHLPGLD